jgi:hypothetical protein
MMTTSESTLRANVNNRFYLRFFLIGVVAIGFSLWSLYDGAVNYPNQRVRALAFQKLVEEDRQAEWREYARERGWPLERPGKPKTQVDFTTQYIMAAIAATAGLGFLLVVLRSRGRWMEATPTGIRTSWSQQCDFDRVLTLNKKHWREKGIAKVTYQEGKRKRRLVLDSYKFERPAVNDILYELESRIGQEKIVGGPPEALREEPVEDRERAEDSE